MIVRDTSKGPVNIQALAAMVTRPRPPRILPNIPRPTLISNQLRGCDGACGAGKLGLWTLPTTGTGGTGTTGSILGAVATGANFVPGIGTLAGSVISIFSAAITTFQSWLGIGSGRREADVIVPVQNNLMSRLGQITMAIDAAQSPSVNTLRAYYQEVWQLAVGFMEYVLQPVFTDRRASGQALNTVMPYIDGSCGYPVPLGNAIPNAVQQNCISWGDGTLGGVGTNGMLGALSRAIQAAGGSVPTMPATIIQAANSGFKAESLPPIGATTKGTSTLLALGVGLFALLKWKVL